MPVLGQTGLSVSVYTFRTSLVSTAEKDSHAPAATRQWNDADLRIRAPKTKLGPDRVLTQGQRWSQGLDIKSDVRRTSDDSRRSVLVWIHGGALINGHRETVNNRIGQWADKAGYVLVSIDYRLAPETRLPEIIRDMEDALSWIRSEGPRMFHTDTAKIAVAGGSAVGYLTLTAGF